MHYDTVELSEMDYDADIGAYTYPCPCGDVFVLDPDVWYCFTRHLGDNTKKTLSFTLSSNENHEYSRNSSPSLLCFQQAPGLNFG